MLGRQLTYTRRKQTSECFNGEKFERPITRKNCACTEENYICEMGFARKVESMECKPTEDFAAQNGVPMNCEHNDHVFAAGYRKVVGDTCEGGWMPQSVMVPCPAKAKLTRGGMSMIGTICVVAAVMFLAHYMSQSDKVKGVFANYGFDNFNSVSYAQIGAKGPETAMESVGVRFDEDFIEDDFADNAPQLIPHSRDEKPKVLRSIDTAASSVPKLQGPPGGTSNAADDDSVDLL
jgi:hypothetical protein